MSRTSWQWWGFILPIVLATLLTMGCEPSLSTVSGNVTVDGKPLEKGAISYVPADAKGVPVTADVAGGKYELQVMAGKKFVQITAPVVIKKEKQSDAPDAPYIEFTAESLPEKYNTKTELKFDVQPGQIRLIGLHEGLDQWVAVRDADHVHVQ